MEIVSGTIRQKNSEGRYGHIEGSNAQIARGAVDGDYRLRYSHLGSITGTSSV
jgi:hypothetical protein